MSQYKDLVGLKIKRCEVSGAVARARVWVKRS